MTKWKKLELKPSPYWPLCFDETLKPYSQPPRPMSNIPSDPQRLRINN